MAETGDLSEVARTSTLTPRQEGFAQADIETANASEAYRRACKTASMKPTTVNRVAEAFLGNPKIAARLDELKALHLERHNLTIDDISGMLQEDRALACELAAPEGKDWKGRTKFPTDSLATLVDWTKLRLPQAISFQARPIQR